VEEIMTYNHPPVVSDLAGERQPSAQPQPFDSRRAAPIMLAEPVHVPWPLKGGPQRSRWRLPAAVGALTEAVGHIPVTQEHLTEAPYIGVGFILLTVAGFVLAQVLLLADTQAAWIWTAITSAVALVGYVLSRTVGLPQIRDDIGNWSEPLAIVCIAAEAVMLAAACLHLGARRGPSVRTASQPY
jgi:hypothetical protein